MHAAFTTSPENPAKLYLVTSNGWESAELPAALGAFARAQDFRGEAGQLVVLPDAQGRIAQVLFGLGDGRDALATAALSARLPGGDYEVALAPDDWALAWIAAGWADGAYRFERYRSKPVEKPRLALPEGGEARSLSRLAEAVSRVRDLVNTPAEDMGPNGLQAAVSDLAESHGAHVEVVTGDALLDHGFPLVHGVGRAAAIAPRFIELSWGEEAHPELALVGKGVAFDSGGLNLKGAKGMRHMKKDMGGAAHAIALAGLVMEAGLPVHLKLYVPAVENGVSGNSFRPGDILRSRKGLTVEIDNTDAEGRLILADALAYACERDPDLVIDFATLTGAARVALGPDLAPVYCDDDALVAALEACASQTGDPVWRMPLWTPYNAMFSSAIADLQNAGGPMAGSITAALFLKHFVDAPRWMHFDVWAWREAKYGRPEGGAANALRATWAMLEARYAG